ncbi:hypothetical protein IMG5_174220 [Ichthyophthirius multifiliis]|uniref:Aminopeptidase n=1 Tax=Ichthyophthirius multifiliis TaxID=5932 RepID=G0R213_ICHMU|nr:hypothetical protein IMG5_174220 [Ichthyophthirius multifiliis]EGR28494.1 hypothetical protein IMG5_174220 [Ichthyophthirius multifiliis]|eukprot:XP_004029730.1 hypothetical protein IMG5_174220 [Ichthyophthirius multifiliis]
MSEIPRFLTQKQAQLREQQIVQNSTEYHLQLLLNEFDRYQGILDVSFVTQNCTHDLFLDYSGQNLEHVLINGKEVQKTQNSYNNIWDGLFIRVPSHYLINGKNQISIYFHSEYANNGLGLHSFVDTDQKQYIYSQCEPYWCNKIFPCFDQPDLKATLNLVIIGPSKWVLLSNESPINQQKKFSLEQYQQNLQGNYSKTFLNQLIGNIKDENQYQYVFYKKTQILPTYLFGIVAGPYAEIKYQNTHKNIPMSIFSRESLLPHLQKMSDFIFEVTNDSMRLFEEFFGYPYPFSKYDQVYVPEYNVGAMENAGLVTFNDLYVFRETVTASRMTSLANTITHELSHHWFGNLVTMKWWNDLWLNESFADFISHFILSKMNVKSIQLVDIWVKFNVNKSWGYRTDQLITTHPIACAVENTEAADSIFDGISYSKGSATLRQLLCLMGEQSFSKALQTHFHKYAFKNATLDDFIEVLNEEFQKSNQYPFSLNEWQQKWIQTAGLNECQPIFNKESKSKETVLKIKQTAALQQHPTLRRHKMKVAFFDSEGNVTSQDVLLDEKEETSIVYDGSKSEFQAVLLNYQDFAFIKVLLDDLSIVFFKNNMHKIKDVLTRNLIWRAFFDMVRDGKLSSEEYFDIFMTAIPHEQSDDIITNQLMFLNSAYSQFTPRKYQNQLAARMFNFLVSYLLKIPKENKNRIIEIKDKLDFFARNNEHIVYLLDWYNGNNQDLKDFELGNSIEWRIVSLVHKSKKFTRDQKNSLFNIQSQKDQTDTKYNYEYKCKALDANQQEREQLWNSYINYDGKTSLRRIQFSWSGFSQTFNPDELEPYYQKFFDSVIVIHSKQNKEYANDFYQYLFPVSEDWDRLIKSLNQLKSGLSDKYVHLHRHINESIDDINRKQKNHQCFMQRASLAKM